MAKKTGFGPDFGPFLPKFEPPFFFFFSKNLVLRQSLDIMVSYHHVQYQKKPMIQSSEN